MTGKPLRIAHPLLDLLRSLDQEIARRFPSQNDAGLGYIGLILTPTLRNGGYHCTPENSLSFAHTGGEGVHFSLVSEANEITENSPIVVTIPQAFDHPNFIVGETLYDFLCFGIYRGFFALEQLGYNLDEAFSVYADPSWLPSEHRHFRVGYGVDERQRDILNLLIERLRLVPWQEPRAKFDRLQETHLSNLEIPPEVDYTEIHLRKARRSLAMSLANLVEHLSQWIGIVCNTKNSSNGLAIVPQNTRTNILIGVDEVGSPSHAQLQIGFSDDPNLAERLVQAFEEAGWELYDPEEDE
jgi:hypothetical protein